jgi:hypothetical protein
LAAQVEQEVHLPLLVQQQLAEAAVVAVVNLVVLQAQAESAVAVLVLQQQE